MRRGLFLMLALALPPIAADERKPNTLTPKEITDGWLLLFDGETTFGWKIDGEVKVEKGQLVLGGDKPTKASVPALSGEYVMIATMKVVGSGKVSIAQGSGGGLGVRESGPSNYELVSSAVASRGQPLTVSVSAGTRAYLSNVRLQPKSLEPLFNGKDLSGWKVYQGDPKREKSKWSVTKEGWLNVKDGPGDLQTEKQFDDFVLQFDCISNGKHLNSGLFFRCEPGQYQQGYEAQIRNQFTEKPTQKYTVEEFDPKSHKLLGKKEVLSTAFDYGTGAIYRRVPARKGIAKDGEWFTMTVVARGRHVATFVNGVQVVDWTDNRKEGDNARTGYRSKAGPFSIQGHDPTTDLSFRSIRAATLSRQ